ncbi:PLP-dependent cysteine synthase family protein [Endozoicomonas sp. ALB115]|uniref:PLP-dependent cysteine synthase family protein n=1 Tax=Endozoicomonas sp. ALB115 TaxID=3403074 RepID=UPI003BB67ABB
MQSRLKTAIEKNKVYESVMDAVGNTPIVALSRLYSDHLDVEVLAKLEFMNPSGSIKDRMVRYMLRYAESKQKLKNQRIVENSSGNTGAALAMASAVLQLDCEIFVPDTTSSEKINRIQAYGADVQSCRSDVSEDNLESYYSLARTRAEESNAFHLDQYCSELNREAHYMDTAPELWEQTAGKIDYFICGIGSGGTISGIGRFLKERNPNIQIIGVEPSGSIYKSVVDQSVAIDTFSTNIEGLGKKKPAESFDSTFVDDVIQVPDNKSLEFCHRLAREEGILAGGSSGSIAAGIDLLLPKIKRGRVATLFPDSGVFYLSKYF